MLVKIFFKNIFLKLYLVGCFWKFNLSKITRYTVSHSILISSRFLVRFAQGPALWENKSFTHWYNNICISCVTGLYYELYYYFHQHKSYTQWLARGHWGFLFVISTMNICEYWALICFHAPQMPLAIWLSWWCPLEHGGRRCLDFWHEYFRTWGIFGQ